MSTQPRCDACGKRKDTTPCCSTGFGYKEQPLRWCADCIQGHRDVAHKPDPRTPEP